MTERTERVTARSLVDAATALADEGEVVAAVRMFQRALTLLDESFDGDELVAATRIRCSALLADLGRDAEAAAMLR